MIPMILLTTNIEAIYRRSYVADHFVYDTRNKSIHPLSLSGKQQLAAFSPGSDKVAFVRENNIYISDIGTGTEIQVTFDGKKNEIIKPLL